MTQLVFVPDGSHQTQQPRIPRQVVHLPLPMVQEQLFAQQHASPAAASFCRGADFWMPGRHHVRGNLPQQLLQRQGTHVATLGFQTADRKS